MKPEQPFLPLTKLVFGFVALNALAAGLALSSVPAWAGPRFVWPIQTPINTALLGALYLSGAVAVIYVILRNHWGLARFFVPVLVSAGVLITLVTLVHRDRFTVNGIFWYWLVVYTVAPLLVIGLYWRQERQGDDWEVHEPVRPLTRWLALLTGAATMILGLGLLWRPLAVLDAWPWPTTPLILRFFAAWFTAFGVGLLWFLVERDWRRMHLLPTLMVGAVLLDLLMVYLHRSAITNPGLPLWLYCGHLLLFGAVGVLLHGLQWRRRTQPNTKPAPVATLLL